jgi:hypothetical protein
MCRQIALCHTGPLSQKEHSSLLSQNVPGRSWIGPGAPMLCLEVTNMTLIEAVNKVKLKTCYLFPCHTEESTQLNRSPLMSHMTHKVC